MIVGVGSRGDVAPYVGLGRRLQEAGCAVAVATHDTFAALVGEAGLEWRRLPGDPRSLIRARMRSGAPAASLADVRADTTSFLTGIGDGIADAARSGTNRDTGSEPPNWPDVWRTTTGRPPSWPGSSASSAEPGSTGSGGIAAVRAIRSGAQGIVTMIRSTPDKPSSGSPPARRSPRAETCDA